uniref:hypothetical protein n=1 Tax=Clostridium sp. TaxID=1506 RepID=UPI0035A041C1
ADYSFQFGICMKYLLSEKEVKNIMVELKGSPKQVAWAEKIRVEKLEKLQKGLEFFTKQAEKQTRKSSRAAMVLEGFARTIEILENAEDAATWIDLRWNSFTPVGNKLAEETKRFLG